MSYFILYNFFSGLLLCEKRKEKVTKMVYFVNLTSLKIHIRSFIFYCIHFINACHMISNNIILYT